MLLGSRFWRQNSCLRTNTFPDAEPRAEKMGDAVQSSTSIVHRVTESPLSQCCNILPSEDSGPERPELVAAEVPISLSDPRAVECPD